MDRTQNTLPEDYPYPRMSWMNGETHRMIVNFKRGVDALGLSIMGMPQVHVIVAEIQRRLYSEATSYEEARSYYDEIIEPSIHTYIALIGSRES